MRTAFVVYQPNGNRIVVYPRSAAHDFDAEEALRAAAESLHGPGHSCDHDLIEILDEAADPAAFADAVRLPRGQVFRSSHFGRCDVRRPMFSPLASAD